MYLLEGKVIEIDEVANTAKNENANISPELVTSDNNSNINDFSIVQEKQKYLKLWENDPLLAGWLTENMSTKKTVK